MPSDPAQDKKVHPASTSRRGLKWALFAAGVCAALVSVVLVIPDSGGALQTRPVITHKIAREDVIVTVTEQGTLESSDNTEIKCKVRGQNTVIWVVESGTEVEPGDVLVRLDTLALEDDIAERTKYAHLTKSEAERSRADVARAELAIQQYLEGRYRADLMTMEKDLIIAKSNLRTAQNILTHAETMAERGYESDLQIDQKKFAVTRAELDVDMKNTQIEILKKYTRQMQLETLNGALRAAKAKLAADEERARMDAIRRDQAIEELEYCVIKAERSGLVIRPSAAQWKGVPEIEEGASVYMTQTLLLMPNLSKMQVKVGIHESIVDRVESGLDATITLPDKVLEGKVFSVALVTKPAGWWTGNVVKYDTIVELPATEGLKPGMSAEVEVILVRHQDVVAIPVAAVLETEEGDYCWVKTAGGTNKRKLELGDTNDSFVVVEGGLVEGEEVVLDPVASIEEAQMLAIKPLEQSSMGELEGLGSDERASQPSHGEGEDGE